MRQHQPPVVRQLCESDVCADCYLPTRVSKIERDVAVVRADLGDVTAELRAEAQRLNSAISGHIKNLAGVIVRFTSKLDHANTSMDELLTGMSELGASVKANIKRRNSRRTTKASE